MALALLLLISSGCVGEKPKETKELIVTQAPTPTATDAPTIIKDPLPGLIGLDKVENYTEVINNIVCGTLRTKERKVLESSGLILENSRKDL